MNKLLVEGAEEQHVIPHLLDKHIVWGDIPEEWPVKIHQFGGIEKMLSSGAISAQLKASDLRAVGIIVDANSDAQNRFNQISSRVKEVFSNFDAKLTDDGVVWRSASNITVGIWVMPDNSGNGMLETFLAYLLDSSTERLWKHVCDFADEAKKLGGGYKDVHLDKARIHSFLAVQDEPGHSLGVAAQKKSFDLRPKVAKQFVDWFTKVFQVTDLIR